jgi:hypothetical protein
MIKKLVNEALTIYSYLKEEAEFDPFGHGEQPSGENTSDENICLLKFSRSNSKLDWPYLSLPAGYTCPHATSCKSFAVKRGTKFSGDKSLKAASEKTKFTCFAARAQAQYPDLNKQVFSNLKLITVAEKDGGVDGMAKLIADSLKYSGLQNTPVFRIHEGGDFYSKNYMAAWIQVAKMFPNINFYTHTTSIPEWAALRASMPSNFNLVASWDDENETNKALILKNKLRYSKVVYSVEEAKQLKLPIDYDDTLACCSNKNFALLLHGGQPAGSEASKAVSANKKAGDYEKVKTLHKINKPARTKLMQQKFNNTEEI